MSDGKDANSGTQVAQTYRPTPEEFAAVESLTSRRKTRPPAPKLKITRSGKGVSVALDYPDKDTGWLMLVTRWVA